ncbi:uncharacterized protein ASCRUDRAFT_76933 [Ascoidea rubescens DSM 1968]|uniref:Uncharacterized protein n=1 Tax=Ascoidea rubescens DSM 1968 TaxID=1344418 RepID=A0A1D2VDJ8_9ASCO|nr:hypothetical protein ASCRUDRAFT_76933 [Ascoidea rubescens DSM 1968]ODV59537.1 hypothetical protein ASCRUDRAFT_76933 [Ascoidea rubescens DSM 1968]
MAQGNLKLKDKPLKRITKKQKNPRKAAPKIIKPKKTSKLKTTKNLGTFQKYGNIISSTEKLIASRIGHLELVKGSKREIKKSDKSRK